MTLQEFQSLRKYAYAEKQYRSFFSISRKSKRSIRGKAKGVGQILKHSKIIPQVNMETIFIKRD